MAAVVVAAFGFEELKCGGALSQYACHAALPAGPPVPRSSLNRSARRAAWRMIRREEGVDDAA
ncbi:hypothetical protein [Streptomyces sp. NPDC000880]